VTSSQIIKPSHANPILSVGVLADTHIPDRAFELHPDIASTFTGQAVSLILHAGDICAPGVLSELKKVAPVVAVRGNRDWVFHNKLPLVQSLELAGVKVALMHGHGGFLNYLKDKWYYYAEGYRLKRYKRLLLETLPDANVIVFGHTHYAENLQDNGKLLFNPGSACMGWKPGGEPSVGVLRFYNGGQVVGEIIKLNEHHLQDRRWTQD
jgi:putative phosphoesterase